MTVSVAVPETPSTVAVIVVEPASFAVASPVELMVALSVSLLFQENDLPGITVLSDS